MHRPSPGIPALLLAAALAAQNDNGLVLRADPDNLVAAALTGKWSADDALGRRLGAQGFAPSFEFAADAGVLARVPAAAARQIGDRRILQAGIATLPDGKYLYVLTTDSGLPALFTLAERDGAVVAAATLLRVCVVYGASRADDLLFLHLAGDERAAKGVFARVSAVPLLTPQAVIADMQRRIAGKDYLGLIKTYMAPKDMAMVKERGEMLEKIAEGFAGERAQELQKLLDRCTKMEPEMSEEGNVATWKVEGDTPVMLQRIDGRWYVKDR